MHSYNSRIPMGRFHCAQLPLIHVVAAPKNYTAVTAISIAITLSGVVRLNSHIMITTNEVKIN